MRHKIFWKHLAKFRAKLPAIILLSFMVVCSLIYLNQQQNIDERYQRLLEVDSEEPSTCKIPAPDPWDPTILSYVNRYPPLKCEQIQPSFTYLSNHTLYLNTTAISSAGYSVESLNCLYRHFYRKTDKENYFEDWREITGPTVITTEFVEVKCSRKMLPVTIYNHLHSQIIVNTTTTTTVKKENSKNPENKSQKLKAKIEKKYSVLLFVVDSVSQQHWQRGLNGTLKVLKEVYNSTVFKGFAKVADNSFPNAMAFLTGKDVNSDPLPGPCTGSNFDDWPLIWKDYKKTGYKTFYAEDYPDFNLFNYLSNGFNQQPVDHYFRPYWLEVYNNMIYRRSTYLCYNEEPMHTIQLRYLKEFIEGYRDTPFFAVNWLTELAHDHLSQVSSADSDFSHFFSQLYPHLEDSFVFVFSDHGHRFDSIRQTMIGRLEERMPFFSLHIPSSLRKIKGLPEIINDNSKVLTSFYDLYITLQDILDLNERGAWNELSESRTGTSHGLYGSDGFNASKNSGKTRDQNSNLFKKFRQLAPRGLSLLRPLPTRKCKETGIPEEYCICQKEQTISKDDPVVIQAANKLVSHLNLLLEPTKDKCAVLVLDSIKGASSSIPSKSLVKEDRILRSYSYGIYINYLIMITVQPSEAMFEATLRHDLSSDDISVIGDVNRINRYGNQSICVDSPVLRKFCFCQ